MSMSKSVMCCALKYAQLFGFFYTRRSLFFGHKMATVERFNTYDDVVSFRRNQASRSALIEVKNEGSVHTVINVCGIFGTLNNIILFGKDNDLEKMLVLVEFEKVEQVNKLLKNCTHSMSSQHKTEVFSRFLFCENGAGKKSVKDLVKMGVVNVYKTPDNQKLILDAISKATVDDQLTSFYESQCISDLDFRLRYLLCTQFENSFSGMFPQWNVYPVGTSVNGFGRRNDTFHFAFAYDGPPSESSSLTFQTSHQPKANMKEAFFVLGKLIRNFLPCMDNVSRISYCGIQCIEMHHTLIGVDCRLMFNNRTAYYMSELLYLFGELDARARPLDSIIQAWARQKHLTCDKAGSQLTNLQLTWLVVFFLQNVKPPILPSLETLKLLADPDDERFAGDIDCTFQRKLSKLPRSENTDGLGELLICFFDFYKTSFKKQGAVSIFSGLFSQNLDGSPLYIQAPLDLNANMSRNVDARNIKAFIKEVNHTSNGLRKILPTHIVSNLLGDPAKVRLQSQSKKCIRFLFPKNVSDIDVTTTEAMPAMVRIRQSQPAGDAIERVKFDVKRNELNNFSEVLDENLTEKKAGKKSKT